ncbi:DNA cytosine methyltransferase [Longispora sp. NPDC051575]|uniref:DNA cytosine methyltransferase n=1 Tax=Longispora sp. NPDC051575 TaxID=3154943 RepID=UPI0034281DCD
MTLTLTDLFCGAGGSSSGAERVDGVRTVMAANHWDRAIATHNHNLPHAAHDCADISQVDPRRYPATDILWASPECTNHSQAKGVRDADKVPDLFDQVLPSDAAERSRATMWDVVRFIEAKWLAGRPYGGFVVENVVEVVKWLPYGAWRTALENYGYCLHSTYLNSMFAQAGGDGAPQSRDRWYAVGHLKTTGRCPDLRTWTRPLATCDRCGVTQRPVQAWKNPRKQWGRYGSHGQYVWACPTTACRGNRVHPTVLPAAAAIDWSLTGTRVGDRPTPLADKTMARIRAGLQRYARPVMVPTGGTWRTDAVPLDQPMPARTTRENDGVGVPPFLALLRSDRARTIGIDEPLATIVSDGSGHALVHPQPLPGRAATPLLVGLEGRGDHVRPVDAPMRVQTGRHQDALVVPGHVQAGDGAVGWPDLLVPYYGTGVARTASQPMGALTTRDRYAFLTSGVATSLDPLDCHFRMLEPSEIQLAMAFDPRYEILGTRRERVRQAGNAVTPPAARDLIAALAEAITGQTPTFDGRAVDLGRERDLVGAR